MNWRSGIVVGLVVALLTLIAVECTELTFELEDNARQCFYEDIKKDTKGTLEFQVSVQFVLGFKTTIFLKLFILREWFGDFTQTNQ